MDAVLISRDLDLDMSYVKLEDLVRDQRALVSLHSQPKVGFFWSLKEMVMICPACDRQSIKIQTLYEKSGVVHAGYAEILEHEALVCSSCGHIAAVDHEFGYGN